MPAAAIPAWALITSAAIPAGAQVAGAVMQSRSAKHAADTQAQAADRALAYEQQQYQQARDDYNNWLGSGELSRLSELLKVSPGYASQPGASQALASPPMPMMRAIGSGQTPAAAAANAPVSASQMVLLQAPNGQRQLVHPSRVPHFVQRGATVVG